jgi:hypothetical protein
MEVFKRTQELCRSGTNQRKSKFDCAAVLIVCGLTAHTITRAAPQSCTLKLILASSGVILLEAAAHPPQTQAHPQPRPRWEGSLAAS